MKSLTRRGVILRNFLGALTAGGVLCCAVAVRADTFVWNGQGVSGSGQVLNTAGNWLPNTGTPTPWSTASISFSSNGASLGQSAALNVGYFYFTSQGANSGTIVFSQTDKFFDFYAGGANTINFAGSQTSVTNYFTLGDGVNLFTVNFTGGSLVAANGFALNNVAVNLMAANTTLQSAAGFTALGNTVITLTGGTLNAQGSVTLLGNSYLNINGGSYNFNALATALTIGPTASAAFNTAVVNPGGIANWGSLIINFTGTFANAYTGNAGSTLTLSGSSNGATVSTGGITSAGNIVINTGSSLNASGSFVNNPMGLLLVQSGGTFNELATFTNNGGGSILLNSGTGNLILNSSAGANAFVNGGVISSNGTSDFMKWTWGGSQVALNSGTINFSAGGSLLFVVLPTLANGSTLSFTNTGTIIVGAGGLTILNNTASANLQFTNTGYIDSRLGALSIGGSGSVSTTGFSNNGIILLGNGGMTLSAGLATGGVNALFSNTGWIIFSGNSTGTLDFEGNSLHNRVVNTGTIASIGNNGSLDATRSQLEATLTAVASPESAGYSFTLGGVYQAGSFSGGAGNNGTIVLPTGFLGGNG
jgi:hypothetical protein